MANCLEYSEQRTESCGHYEDRGYSACARWDSGCCTWWPCSWGCKLLTWICGAWTWVSSVVCVLWTVVTTLVCAVWEMAATVVSAVVEVLDVIVGWVLNAAAFVVELIFAIPFVGRVLHWIWNAIILNAIWLTVNLVDATLYFLGVRPQKKLRVCAIVLQDEEGIALGQVADVVDTLNDTIEILLRECNVQLINSAPLQFSSGLSFDPIRADASWVHIDGAPSPPELLDVRCDAVGMREDLKLVGSQFQLKGQAGCFWANWRRVLGLGAPVTIFIVRGIDQGTQSPKGGCALWWPNYLTIAAADLTAPRPRRVLAHELGHMCNLWHVCDEPNLMCVITDGCSTCTRGPLLRFWQEMLFRASRHVSYF
jgi:hypothetical protein